MSHFLNRHPWALYAVLGSAFLAGCSGSLIETRQTGHLNANNKPTTAEGFSYYLPRRMAEVTMTRRAETPALSPNAALAALTKANQTKAGAKKAERKAASARAAAVKGQHGTKEIQRLTILDDAAKRDLADAIREATAAQTNYDKALLAADAASKGQVVKWEESITLKLLPIEPDPKYRMQAHFDRSMLRDNTINLTVKDGLLESGSGTSRDETAPIIVAIASTAAALFSPAGGVPKNVVIQNVPLAVTPPQKTPFNRALIIDPTKTDDIEQQINLVLNDNDFDFLVRKQATSRSQQDGGATPHACIESRHGGCGGLLYRQTPSHIWDIVVSGTPKLSSANGKTTAISVAQGDGEVTKQIRFSAPNTSETMLLPLDTAALVTSKHQFKFAAGALISHSVEKPSTALAAASLPLDVMRAIISVPTELIQLRVNHSSAANDGVDQQVRLLEAQKKLLDAQTAYDEAVTSAAE